MAASIGSASPATKRGTRIAYLDPSGGKNQTSPVNLSPLDERKLYYGYVINKAGGEKGPFVDDLYEYNLDTGMRTRA